MRDKRTPKDVCEEAIIRRDGENNGFLAGVPLLPPPSHAVWRPIPFPFPLERFFSLIFADPFKVSNVTPSLVSPAQNIYLTVSGISCQDWLQYFVRFQTANGTKKTQQEICKDSVISCYVPEFSPNTRLRVGLTLSNRLVEWADRKILIQCK